MRWDTIPRQPDRADHRPLPGPLLARVDAERRGPRLGLTRAHRDQGVDLFFQALPADVADIQGGTTPEGIHLAAMAGSVDLLQRCFAGLETRGDRLHLRPLWPESLGVLRFSLVYRDRPLQIAVSGRSAEVTALPCRLGPIEVACRGEVARVEPGSTVRFDLRADHRP